MKIIVEWFFLLSFISVILFLFFNMYKSTFNNIDMKDFEEDDIKKNMDTDIKKVNKKENKIYNGNNIKKDKSRLSVIERKKEYKGSTIIKNKYKHNTTSYKDYKKRHKISR